MTVQDIVMVALGILLIITSIHLVQAKGIIERQRKVIDGLMARAVNEEVARW